MTEVSVKPNPDCKACHGEGEVYDSVPMPFGPGSCAMPSLCDCVTEQVEDENAVIRLDLSDLADRYPEPKMSGGEHIEDAP